MQTAYCVSLPLSSSLPPLLASRCIAPCAGHVLISPRRVVKRFSELSQEEVCDLWQLAQRVGSAIEPHYKASSLTMAIQVCCTRGGGAHLRMEAFLRIP